MKKLIYIILIRASYLYTLEGISLESIHSIINRHPEITCIKTQDEEPFYYKPFPISKFPKYQPNQGVFAENFIVTIPNGQVFSENGYVKIDNNIILEGMYEFHFNWQINNIIKKQNILSKTPKKIPGKVVVVTLLSGWCYYIWMTIVIPRLKMFLDSKIEYDWLYIPMYKPFMKETLMLLGVDTSKIIQPFKDFSYIEADEIIMPFFTNRVLLTNNQLYTNDISLVSFVKNSTIAMIRDAILPLIPANKKNYPKRIFISRQDSRNRRLALNEDAVFEILKTFGFKKYCLTNLSVIEQAALFQNAEIIIGAHGAGLTNILFCKPNTKIIEIFQARSSCTYFYISQQLNLKYDYIQTCEFSDTDKQGSKNTIIPLHLIKNYLKQNLI